MNKLRTLQGYHRGHREKYGVTRRKELLQNHTTDYTDFHRVILNVV